MDSFDQVRPGDSFERWHHTTCRNYSITEARPVPDRNFRASVQAHAWGRLAVSRISSRVTGPHTLTVERYPGDIRRDGRDDFFVWVGLGGTTSLDQNGNRATLGPGDLMLMDQARPFSLAFGKSSASLMVIVPRALLLARLPRIETAAGLRVDGGLAGSRLAAFTAEHCFELSRSTDTNAVPEKTRMAVLDILTVAFEPTVSLPRESRTARQRERLRAVQRFLLNNLDNSELTLGMIGAPTHMSTRTLLRLFKLEDTTPMEWLWTERIRESHSAITNGAFEQVSDVAAAFGFKNLSHFSRRFKDSYGVTPHSLMPREGQ